MGPRKPKQNQSDQGLIAIIGMSGRFPCANNLVEFWNNLIQGKDCVTRFSDEELRKNGVKESDLANPNYVNARGVLEMVDKFDAEFFNYSPREATLTDPQHRIFLECAWEALETAGYVPSEYQGSIGVYGGMGDSNYNNFNCQENKHNIMEEQLNSGAAFLSTKVSYKLGLQGPSININTACSTSLVSVIMACQGLLNYDCDIALAGGISLALPQQGYWYEENGVFAPDGCCRAFDAAAKGFVPGAGVGLVVLKRLEDAFNDNDTIDAVIKGFGINNDGSGKVGYTAPSIEGQSRCIVSAITLAEINPETITYVETHGTGTALGDFIEIEALTKAFNFGTDKKQFCAIGSVKANIGHTGEASGIAGLIKTVLALKNKHIPPSLHFNEPNPNIDFKSSPFYVNTKLQAWLPKDFPRRAGVSSFGIGGTNAHLILEESFLPKQEKTMHNDFILVLSAKTKSALNRNKEGFLLYLQKEQNMFADKKCFADLVYTLQVGRESFNYRVGMLCFGINDAIKQLQNIQENDFKLVHKKQSIRIDISAISSQETLKAWLDGYVFSWSDLYLKEHRRRIHLPTYFFEDNFYWIDSEEQIDEKRFYVPTWESQSSIGDDDSLYNQKFWDKKSKWLVFCGNSDFEKNLTNKFEELKQEVIFVYTGEAFTVLQENKFQVNPKYHQDYIALFMHLDKLNQKPNFILHLWLLGNDLNNLRELGYYSLIFITQAFIFYNLSAPIEYIVISDKLRAVDVSESIIPLKSLIFGPCTVIPQEHNNIKIRCLDVILASSAHGKTLLIENIVREISVNKQERLVALRNRYRWGVKYQRLHAERLKTRTILRERGAYLITGGLGNIGLEIALYLAKKFNAKLILVGRNEFPCEGKWSKIISEGTNQQIINKIKKLREIKKYANELTIFAADVGNRERMQSLFTIIKNKIGKINGVIHAAGNIKDNIYRFILDTNKSISESQFAAKVDGVIFLKEILKNHEMDFCLLCSSMAPILGGIGFTAYVAANAFMDAFVLSEYKRSSFIWLGINWDGWNFANKEVNHQRYLLPYEGIEGFDELLKISNQPQIIFSKTGLDVRIEKAFAQTDTLLGQNESVKVKYDRYKLTAEYLPPRTEIEKQIADVFSNCLGIKEIGIDDDFFELGGHSLLAIKLIEEVNKKLNSSLILPDLYESRTVSQISSFLSVLKNWRKNTNSHIVPLRDDGQKLPIFFIHPAGGLAFMYLLLVKYLNPNRPVYAIQDPILQASKDSFSSLEGMAWSYFEEIKRIQSEGPYLFCGASLGGYLAVAIAHEVQELNGEVAFVGLIDSWAKFSRDLRKRSLFNKIILRQLERIKDSIKYKELFDEKLLDLLWSRMQYVFNYKLPVLDCKLTLFKASELLDEYKAVDDEFNNWLKFSTKGIDLFNIPGNHETMLEEPYVKILAQKFNECLDKLP